MKIIFLVITIWKVLGAFCYKLSSTSFRTDEDQPLNSSVVYDNLNNEHFLNDYINFSEAGSPLDDISNIDRIAESSIVDTGWSDISRKRRSSVVFLQSSATTIGDKFRIWSKIGWKPRRLRSDGNIRRHKKPEKFSKLSFTNLPFPQKEIHKRIQIPDRLAASTEYVVGGEERKTKFEKLGIKGLGRSYLQLHHMAWRSHGKNLAELVGNLASNGIIKSDDVRRAMLRVDRAFFCPRRPYADEPQTIGYGATISAPHMHAMALEILKDHLKPGKKALDVGSGSGYLAVCMSVMLGIDEVLPKDDRVSDKQGSIVGIECIPELVELSRKNTEVAFPDLLKSNHFHLIQGDGWAGGPANLAPYDAIHVGAAAQSIPKNLLNQLAVGGMMVIPVEVKNGNVYVEGGESYPVSGGGYFWGGGQVLLKVEKHTGGNITVNKVTDVVYVPLVKTKQSKNK